MRFEIGRPVIKRKSEAPLPTRMQMARNLGAAMARAGVAVLKREPVWLTPAAAQEHRAICQSNQCGFYRPSDQRCGHPNCGCYTRLKALLATEECPVGLFKRGATLLQAPRSGDA